MEKKYLVITGGSRGIGEKTIARFVDEGWLAVNISRSLCHLPTVKNIAADLSQIETLHEYQEELHSLLFDAQQICLVHNAAYYQPDCIDTLSLVDFKKTMDINVFASMILNQLIIPMMSAGSSIIYLGSTLSEKAVPGSASYTVSKHAIIGLMRATCQDLIAKKIRSLCICPGLVDTVLLKETMSTELIDYLLTHKVIGGRLIQPEEIADIIYFGAITPAINGIVIHANLGQVAE